MKKIDNITIVGGGTSGWLTAAAFLKQIPNIKITLIDKELTNSVGVGEATLLKFGSFLTDYCGFDDNEWLVEVDAVFKSGILFPEWGSDSNMVWHPFYFPHLQDGTPLCDAWCHFQENISINQLLPLYNESLGNKIDTKNLHSYAHHIDCKKLVDYIKKKIKGKINFIQSSVKKINFNDNNSVSSLILNNDIEIISDIYIDCTGFKSILKKDRKRVDLSDRLFCDTAVAGHISYLNKEEELNPYVVSHAVDHGWIWNIPLNSRIGSGLVFNRSITDPEEAKDYFVKYWDNRVERESLKVIDWTPYYDLNMWEENVISIGLSAGFIEPLESTGIALIIEGIYNAIVRLKSRYYNHLDIEQYNIWMKNSFESCIDFVNMHYSIVEKDTKFWNYVKKTHKISETQKIYLDNMSSEDPSYLEGKSLMFGGANWIYWLIQIGFKINKKLYSIKDDLPHKFNNFLYFTRINLQKETTIPHLNFIKEYNKK